MNPKTTAAIDNMVFRKTNKHRGRHISITPANSSMHHLAYGRILLDQSKSAEYYTTGDRETGLIFLSGQASVTVDGKIIENGRA